MITKSNLLDVIVNRKVRLTEQISMYSLASVSSEQKLPEFTAGSHIDVHIGEYIRQYSLCNSPAERDYYEIAVLNDEQSRGGSRAMHERVHEGDIIQISAPRNLFELQAAPHYILLAGGIGITPLLAMSEALHSCGSSFEVHYCTRTAAHAAFHERLLEASFKDKVRFHCDDRKETHLNIPELLKTAPENSHIYFCGPPGFISLVQSTAQELEWHGTRVHFERFEADPDLHATPADAFQVKISSTGQVITVPPGIPITDVLSDHGIVIATSCEQGICGTCITGVIEGEVDHRDQYFTDAERSLHDQLTPCCSRAKSQLLVLDL